MFKALLASSIIAFGSASSPADLISSNGMPLFETIVDSEAFKLNVAILVRTAPSGDDHGESDFNISVTLPNGENVTANCPKAPYFFDDGAMVFDPYGDDASCTGKFRMEMNSKLGGEIVGVPIALVYTEETRALTVSIVAEVKIPFKQFVKETLLL